MRQLAEKIPLLVKDVDRQLRKAGFLSYVVGGAVRDLLLGKTPKDYDIATDATPTEVAVLFPGSLLVGASFGVVLVVGSGAEYPVEVATFRSEGVYTDGRRPEEVRFVLTPEEDAARRDFTINALYLDLATNQVLDFHNGVNHLNNRQLVSVGSAKDRFLEDHLRMLRAVRFAARYRLELDPALVASLRELAPKVNLVAKERVMQELSRVFTQGNVRYALELMDSTGLLEQLLPELAAMHGVAQPVAYHPEGDVWEHTLQAAAFLKPGVNLSAALATVFHDVGKPLTQGTREDGQPTFYGHDEVGANVVRGVLSRLKFPNEVVDSVVWSVSNHMRLYRLADMRPAKALRLVSHPNFEELLQVGEADCAASSQEFTVAEEVKELLANASPKQLQMVGAGLPKPLVNGFDLIQLGMEPGPNFSGLLSELMDLQLEGKFNTKEEGLAYLQARKDN